MKNTIVHVLRNGTALCDLDTPSSWPEGHSWLKEEQFLSGEVFEEKNGKPCGDCKAVLEGKEPTKTDQTLPSEWEEARVIAENLAAKNSHYGATSPLTVEIMKVQQLRAISVALEDIRHELEQLRENHSIKDVVQAIGFVGTT